ncbi:MAG: hypothetical protein H7338_22715 [Candidatus Sericytochromatia bacterium]|nr:hypothetical protein [Candidatus Sericytochromatia bacterium]
MSFRLAAIVMSACIGLSPAAWAAPDDIEQSERYRALRAEMHLRPRAAGGGRELVVNGRRVDDMELAELTGDAAVIATLQGTLMQRRVLWGGIAALGLPSGGFLVSLVSARLYRPTVTIGPGQAGTGLDVGSFLIGTVGTVAVIYGLVYAINLANDLFGLERPPMLRDTEAQALVDRYNARIKAQLWQELNSGTSSSAGTIVGWSRSF